MDIFNKLYDILNEEKSLYSELLDLSEKKTQVIINNQIDELNNIVDKEQAIILQIGKLEGKRQECLDFISKEFNIEADKLNASIIISKLPEGMKREFSTLVNDLSDILHKQRNLNSTNAKLINNNIEFINQVINHVVMGDAKENVYTDSGNRIVKQKRNIIDQTV